MLAHLYLQQKGLNIVHDLAFYTGDATLYVHVTSRTTRGRAQGDARAIWSASVCGTRGFVFITI